MSKLANEWFVGVHPMIGNRNESEFISNLLILDYRITNQHNRATGTVF